MTNAASGSARVGDGEETVGLQAPEPSRLRPAGEIGRIERALFTLDWLESKALRRRCLAGLNKSESRLSLAAGVSTQRQGRLTDRTVESQAFRASGLNPVTAAIVYWNTLYLGRAIPRPITSSPVSHRSVGSICGESPPPAPTTSCPCG